MDNKEKNIKSDNLSNFIFNNIDLPKSYGNNKLIFLVRDPYWGFVYWDISEELLQYHNLLNSETEKYLRVYDITDSENPNDLKVFFDIKINDYANNWYIKFPQPNRKILIDYGYFKNDQFITVLRSNIAKTPRDNISENSDLEWMITDEQFRLIIKASGADELFEQTGSMELLKFLAGNVNEEVSSSMGSMSVSSFSSSITPSC